MLHILLFSSLESKPSFSIMRDGQGCLLPVLRCHRQQLLLEEDPAFIMPWLLPQIYRADVVSQFPEVTPASSTTVTLGEDATSSKAEKRKKPRRVKLKEPAKAGGKAGYGRTGRTNYVCKAGYGYGGTSSIEEGQVLLQEGGEVDAKWVVQDTHGGESEDLAVQVEGKSACTSGGDGSGPENQEDYTSFLPGLDDETALRCLAFVSISDHRRLAKVARRYRSLVTSSLLLELRRINGVVEQWVCIYTSGDGGWTSFDPKQNVWRNLPPANVDPIFDLSDRESLSAGTHLLWLGQEAFKFACYKYDLVTNIWERGPPMINSRCLFASASCGEFAFVAGGFTVGGTQPTILNSAERYDSRKGMWEPLPPMEIPRQKCSGVFMDGKFYVIGGKDKFHNPLRSGEVYDPVSKTWGTIPDMYFPQETAPTFEPSPPLVAVANNQLYAIESSTNLLKSYNKGTNTWKVLGPLPVRTDACNGWGLAFKALGDELFVIGSYRIPPSTRDGVAVFSWRPRLDTAAPEWRPDAPPPEWNLVDWRVRGNGSFLYNCAVMAC